MQRKTKSSNNISYDLKRFSGIKRDYSTTDVEKLRGSFNIEYTLSKKLSEYYFIEEI